MKKLATLLVSTALVGGLTLTSFATTANAADSYRGNNRGNFGNQQQMQMQGPGQNMRGPGMNADDMRGPGARGAFGQGGFAQGGLIGFACSDNGAPRAEIAFNNLSDRLTLDADQTTLFNAFKTAALSAQTAYADACTGPVAADDTPLDPVELLTVRVTNQTANIAAIESVLPSLEAFYNSLSDEQKASFLPQRGEMRVGQGQQGQFGPQRMHWDDDDDGVRGFGPQQGQGFGPGNGQGLGPRNNG